MRKFDGPPRAFDRQAWTADSICLGLAGYLFENQFGHCGSAETGIVFAERNRTSPHRSKSSNTLRFGWMVLGHITQLGVASPGFANGFHLCAMVKLSVLSEVHGKGSWKVYVVMFLVESGLILKD